MHIGPHGGSVLCSWTVFIDEYFLPPLVIGRIIDSIDQGPWESRKRRVFIARCFRESILIITQKGRTAVAEVSYKGAVYILIWLLFVF